LQTTTPTNCRTQALMQQQQWQPPWSWLRGRWVTQYWPNQELLANHDSPPAWPCCSNNSQPRRPILMCSLMWLNTFSFSNRIMLFVRLSLIHGEILVTSAKNCFSVCLWIMTSPEPQWNDTPTICNFSATASLSSGSTPDKGAPNLFDKVKSGTYILKIHQGGNFWNQNDSFLNLNDCKSKRPNN
jgi:hypothetical protein